MQVTVGGVTVNVFAVNVARMIATTAGHDMDLEPMAPGNVKVTATGHGKELFGHGKDAESACHDIINQILKEIQ